MQAISVIIPCYNSSATLRKAVESALAQSYAAVEIICVDDGSVDDSLEILRELESTHNSVKVIRQENAGATAARNRGLAEAKGDFIQFLDADDALLADKLEKQLALLDPETDILVGSYLRHDEAGKELGLKVYPSLQYDPWEHLIRTDLGCTCSNLFRRAKLQEVGGWDVNQKSSQEYDLMFRMLQAGAKVQAGGEYLGTEVLVRSAGSISAGDKGGNWKRYIALRARMRDHLQAVRPDLVAVAEQQIFDSIRLLYPYDKIAAKRYLMELLPANYQPQPSDVTSSFYLKLYGLLGLAGAERLRGLLGR